MIVLGKDIEVWGIQREVVENKSDRPSCTWQSYLNIDG